MKLETSAVTTEPDKGSTKNICFVESLLKREFFLCIFIFSFVIELHFHTCRHVVYIQYVYIGIFASIDLILVLSYTSCEQH